MNTISDRRLWSLLTVLTVLVWAVPLRVSAAIKRITLPSPISGFVGTKSQVGLAHQGAVGLALGVTVGHTTRIVSFTTADAVVSDTAALDDFELTTPDRTTVFGMAVNDHNGLITVSGISGTNLQTVVALVADSAGRITRKWTVTYSVVDAARTEAVINSDGSLVYVFYNDSFPKIDKIRAEDGVIVGTTPLDDTDITAGLTFDAPLKRLIVKTTLNFHVLKSEDDFGLDWRVRAPEGFQLLSHGFISADGRFFIGYGGYGFGNPAETGNHFLTLDLERREFRTLLLGGRLAPSDSALTYSPGLGNLIVPYSSTVKVKNGGISGCACGTQVADWLFLGTGGSLARSVTTRLAGERSTIGPLNNAALSRTSAISFLATTDKRVVAVDTLTGEVVSEQEVGDVFFIYRIGDTDTFLTTNGTNVLNIVELRTGPTINSIKLKKRKLIIQGENLLSGVSVVINGVAAANVSRNQERPGREITVGVGKKDLAPDEPISVVVINRDGLGSDPFTINRD